MEALLEKLKVMIPELLDENGYDNNGEIPFRLLSECSAIASRHATSSHAIPPTKF